MWPSKHAFFIFITSVILSLVCGCSFNAQDERAHCPSFTSLSKAGQHLEWKKLNVNNPGSESFSPIEKNTFKNFPNVKDIQVKGLANDILPGAWNGLDNLYELHLDDNKLHVIGKNAFDNIRCEVIYIYHCEVRELTPRCFSNSPNLKYAFIYGNNISRIEEGVFTDTNLTHVMLRKNHITSVADNAFGNMDKLKFLSLEENDLTSFAPQLAIGYNPTLTHLYINRNKLTKATQDMFAPFPNLQIILMNINRIERFGDHALKNLKELRLLDISNNRLEELQTNVFNVRGMQHLDVLFLHDNKMSFLSSGVLHRLPNLKRITVIGNPWQCPCADILERYLSNHNITQMCADIYNEGKRPTCVFLDTHPKDCIYDVENVRDVPKLYEEILVDYPKLPPVCNIDGTDKPYLNS